MEKQKFIKTIRDRIDFLKLERDKISSIGYYTSKNEYNKNWRTGATLIEVERNIIENEIDSLEWVLTKLIEEPPVIGLSEKDAP